MIARREHPHPGAQLSFCDAAGRRLQVLVTDIADNDADGTDIAYIEALHRGRGRAERQISDHKNTGLAKLPSQSEPPWDSRRVLSLGKREYGYAYTDISGTSFHEEVLGHREGPGGTAGSPVARRVGHRPRDRQTGGGPARLRH